jgi:serine/threonine-protein kinase
VGETESRAREILEGQGFEVAVVREPNTRPEGTVFAQSPQEGELKPTGTTVTISVSSGGEKVKIPRVAGLASDVAIKQLEDLQFQVNTVSERSETVPVNIVIRTTPRGGLRVDPNSVVTVVVSAGPAPIIVPDVTGLDQVDATQRLADAGFRVSKTLADHPTIPAGRVIRTQPAAGTEAPRDSTVTLVVSSGPKQVTVPDVVGQDQGPATSALESADLVVSVVTVTSPGSVGKVLSQTPTGGTKANAGSTVTITVGSAPPTTTSSSTTTTT